MNGPYRMRRYARRMRRYGLQPMAVLSPNDPLPEPVAVFFFRWAWRYRSELAPLFAALAVVLAAALLHNAHPHWWPMILALAAPTLAALLFGGQRIGLITFQERVYAATVVGSAGTWLVIATMIGPFHRPLPVVLLIVGLVLAVPWWAHRRRRAKVRVERILAAWPEIAQTIGLAGSQVMSAVVDVWGWRARFRLARGQNIEDVIAKLPAIESALGTYRGAARVYPTDDSLANRFELRVLDKDPHADAINWPGPSVRSITEPIDLGPFEDAAPARVLFLRRHGLFGGTSGSGKSGGLNVLGVARRARERPHRPEAGGAFGAFGVRGPKSTGRGACSAPSRGRPAPVSRLRSPRPPQAFPVPGSRRRTGWAQARRSPRGRSRSPG